MPQSSLFWILKAIRYRSVTLPALANPRIDAGGICGESKNDILGLAGPVARPWIADFAGCHHLRPCPRATIWPLAEAAMARAGLSYPVVAKPDMSCNGVGVRVVRRRRRTAAPTSPPSRAPRRCNCRRWSTYEGEAGIFYIRHPGEAKGRITSVTLKFAPTVIGDGRTDVRELIAADTRLNAISQLLLPKAGG